VAHAGTLVRGQEDAILGEVARYVPQLLAYLGGSAERYWGPAANMATEHADRRRDSLEASFRRRVAAARLSYDAWATRLAEAALPAVLAALEPTGPEEDFTGFPVDCPACGHVGMLFGEPEPDWEADWDVEGGEGYVVGAYVDSIQLIANGFECPVYRLTLESDGCRSPTSSNASSPKATSTGTSRTRTSRRSPTTTGIERRSVA
jgi:hypothetical protein